MSTRQVLLLLVGVAGVGAIVSVGNVAVPTPDAQHILKICADGTRPQNIGKRDCYVREFGGIALAQGPEVAFQLLREVQKQDPAALGCHFIAHGIGQFTFKRTPINWQKQLNTINGSCNYGAIHGILEQYVSTLPSGTLTKEVLLNICGEKPRGTCNHIMGHLALVETKDSIDQALELCRGLHGEMQKFSCFTGVFMENITGLNLIEHGYRKPSADGQGAKLQELKSLCLKYSGAEGEACWREIAHSAVTRFRYDAKEIFPFCETAQTQQAARYCKLHATDMTLAVQKFQFAKAKELCKLGAVKDVGFEQACYNYVVSSTLVTVPWLEPDVKNFCVSLDTRFQQECLQKIKQVAPHDD